MAKQNKRQHLVSVIIPAFKQEKTIREDILRIKNVMDELRYDYEIIVVVDGQADKTLENAKKASSNKVIVVGYEHNHGKGYAVRYGIVHSKGDIVGFIDSGMDLNPNGLSIMLEQFEWHNADIIVGSKRHPASRVKYPLSRKIISFLSQIFIRLLFGLNVRDTQVGMKFFKREVIGDVFPRLLVKEFAFDIEILVVAYNLGYKKIFEAPVEIKYNFETSLISQSLMSALFKTFWDSLAIFYRLKILRYYDSANKRKWRYDPELNLRVNIG
ncbi:MAG: glycosyltransferase [Candidatus Levybacteria bacterium]|nr:glycosyltransferase [Candidatus Levybacteria bacterium]